MTDPKPTEEQWEAVEFVARLLATREAAAYRRGVEDGAKWGVEQTRKGSRISENFPARLLRETPTEITARAVKELCDA